MNINNLQVQLQTAVENAATEASTDNTSATLYYLQLAKAIQALNMGQIRTIDQVSNLPSAAASEGWLYFVDNIERLYFSNGTAWATIVPVVYSNTIWTWGAGGNGSRGDNTSTGCTSSPGSVVGGFTDWSQVSVGGVNAAANGFGLGLRTNGTAWAWGYNGKGTLGDNTTAPKSSPVSVVGGFTDWSQISAARANSGHSLGLRTNGTLWAWGHNGYGRLGDNTTVSKSSPVSVVGGFTDWSQIFAGNNFSLAIRTNGTLWSWGSYSFGKLGTNEAVNRSSPVSVVGGFTDWCQISAFYQSLGVRTNGTLWAWGYNSRGQLGDNTSTGRSSPVSVVGGYTDWCHAAAGSRHSLGVRTNGTLWSWGGNNFGQLGDNTTVSKSSPVSVVGGFTDWCQLSAQYQSLGVRTNGTAWAWGCNATGVLGDNTTVSKSSPVSVVGGFTDWCQVAATYGGSAGLRTTAT